MVSQRIERSNEYQTAHQLSTALHAYWKTFVKRCIDQICITIDSDILRQFSVLLQTKFMKLCESEEFEALVREDPRLVNRRSMLQSQIERLRGGRKLLAKF